MARVEASSLESLQVLLQQNPDSLTFAHVADVLLKSGRLEEATQICEEGIRRHPYYVTGHMVLGKCYLQKKQFDQAEKEFKRVLLFDPKHLAAHKHFADLMRRMGWQNTCETSYRKIVQIDPLEKTAQAVLDELAQEAEQMHPPSAPPPAEPFEPETPVRAFEPERPFESPISFETPAATAPVDDEELLAASGIEEEDLIREPQPAEEPSGREMNEEKFASILDDIFQDEVVDDRARVERPPHLQPPPAEPDFAGAIELGEAQPSRPEKPSRPPRPTLAHRDEAEDDILGPARPAPGEKPPSFIADLSLDDTPAPPGKLDIMAIEGLEPQVRPRVPAAPERTPAPPQEKPVPPKSPPSAEPGGLPGRASEREKIVTPTLGEIYAAQGQFAKAIGVFELLLRKDPNNRIFRERIDYLKKRLQETQNAG